LVSVLRYQEIEAGKSSRAKKEVRMMKVKLILVATMIFAFGLTSTAVAAEFSAVVKAPDQYFGKQIEITAPVAVNSEPRGGEYKTWNFTVGSQSSQLKVEDKGFNPAVIEKAYMLVEEARRAGNEMTFSGRLKATDEGPVFELRTLQYNGTTIHMNEGPFVNPVYEDSYPGSPKFYDGYTYYPGHFPY
jgi:hypothetical protein